MLTALWIKRHYEVRIKNLLAEIGKHCTAQGFGVQSTPDDVTDDEYTWSIPVRTPKGFVDIRFTVAEAKVREPKCKTGFAFSLSITAIDGTVIGGLTPCNFSGALWCNAADELNDRWGMIADSDIQQIPRLIRSMYVEA